MSEQHFTPIPALFAPSIEPHAREDAAFDAENPGVYRLFCELAEKIMGLGWERYSADAILHQIRWHRRIEKGDRLFKCNDHWTAYLGRRLARERVEFKEFFEFRERRVG